MNRRGSEFLSPELFSTPAGKTGDSFSQFVDGLDGMTRLELATRILIGHTEIHLLRRVAAMLIAKMAVDLHRKRSPVFMPEPAGYGGHVYGRFYPDSCKEVAEVVVGDVGRASRFTCFAQRASHV